MGLKNVFEKGAQTAIKTFGDVRADATYRSYVSTVYSVTTGTQTVTYSTVAGLKIIIDGWKQMDNDEIRMGDRKFMIASLDLGIEPKTADVVVVDGVEWNVVNVLTDPAEALWELQVRKS